MSDLPHKIVPRQITRAFGAEACPGGKRHCGILGYFMELVLLSQPGSLLSPDILKTEFIFQESVSVIDAEAER